MFAKQLTFWMQLKLEPIILTKNMSVQANAK
jgi:hypothetical protein